MGKHSGKKKWRREMSLAGKKVYPSRETRLIRLGLEREGVDVPSDAGDEKACLECGWPIPVNGYAICRGCSDVGDTAA